MDFSFPWGEEEKPKDRVYFTSKNTEIEELVTELESMKIPKQKK